MYYGEEIGMANNDPKRKEDVKDPIGRIGWPAEIGRDGERTPMQWNSSSNAGFTTGTSWLPIPDSYKTHNVATEEKDPNSVLSFYKKLLSLRKHNPALRDGDYVPLNQDHPNVLVYLRQAQNATVLVALNMSPNPQTVHVDLSRLSTNAAKLHPLLGAPASQAKQASAPAVKLEPFGVYIAQIAH